MTVDSAAAAERNRFVQRLLVMMSQVHIASAVVFAFEGPSTKLRVCIET